MARPSCCFANLFHRQNLRNFQNPNNQIRSIGVGGTAGGGEEFIVRSHDQLILQNSEHQKITEIAKEVARIIRTRPRWEQTLSSDFPEVNFSEPNLFRGVLEHQRNTLLSLRFFYWVSSQPGFLLDESMCNVIFGSLVEAKAANAAKEFLKLMKFTPERASLEAYAQCLCENGLVEDAVDVLDQLKQRGICPSLGTWNSALLGFVRAGRTDIVWKLYAEMLEYAIAADTETTECLIQAFCIENKASKGYELLRQVLEAGLLPSGVVFNKLMFGFCKDGNYSMVSSLLHTMIAKNQAPDIFTYQEIIKGLCKRRMRHEGFRIFNDLKDRGYTPDRVMYTTMIHGLCEMKWLGNARRLWFEMIQKGIIPNEYTYNVLINGYFKNGNLEEAQKLSEEMCDRGYGESTVSYNTMINGLCLHEKTETACELFNQMAVKGISHDVITYNSLIQGLCKEGKITEGANLLYELLKLGLQPSTASYTVLIEKLCEEGHVHEVKTLWTDMQDRGVEPAACTHDFIITALCKQGYVEEGIEWLFTVLRNRLRPRKETFERLIQRLSQGDKLDDALLVLDYMFKLGYALSECVCYSVVTRLCKDYPHYVETSIAHVLD